MNNYYQSEGNVLTDVDQTVVMVLFGKVDHTQLALALNYLYPAMMYHYDHEQEYTQTIEWFVHATQLLKGEYYPSEVIWDQQSTNDFIYKIQSYRLLYDMSRKTFSLQEALNTGSLKEYLTQLFAHCSRLLVVRVDLHYQIEHRGDISVGDFNDHMKALRERMSNQKGCFKGLEGYAWSLEQGYKQIKGHDKKGSLHCHLVLLYNGAKKDNGYHSGRSVGEKWISMTDGQGSYFNCNDPKYFNQFKVKDILGIGMIHRKNFDEVQNAINTLLYLTTKKDKYEQRLKAKLPNMRSFGHGTYRNTKRRGLPPISN